MPEIPMFLIAFTALLVWGWFEKSRQPPDLVVTIAIDMSQFVRVMNKAGASMDDWSQAMARLNKAMSATSDSISKFGEAWRA